MSVATRMCHFLALCFEQRHPWWMILSSKPAFPNTAGWNPTLLDVQQLPSTFTINLSSSYVRLKAIHIGNQPGPLMRHLLILPYLPWYHPIPNLSDEHHHTFKGYGLAISSPFKEFLTAFFRCKKNDAIRRKGQFLPEWKKGGEVRRILIDERRFAKSCCKMETHILGKLSSFVSWSNGNLWIQQ